MARIAVSAEATEKLLRTVAGRPFLLKTELSAYGENHRVKVDSAVHPGLYYKAEPISIIITQMLTDRATFDETLARITEENSSLKEQVKMLTSTISKLNDTIAMLASHGLSKKD